MIFISASMPSSMSVKARFWWPPSTSEMFSPDDVAEELGHHARRTFFRRVDRIQAGADPVEWTEQGEVQAFHAVAPDHAVHQLLGVGVDPARLVDRAADQFRILRIEFLVVAHAIHFGGRREHQVLAVARSGAHDRQVGFEVQLKHAQRRFDVGRRGGDGHQRQDHVALLDVVVDPLLVDGDVAFKEVHARMRQQIADTVGIHVHAIDMPVGGFQDALGQWWPIKPFTPRMRTFSFKAAARFQSGQFA
jgi:hypothetical protein